MLLAGVVAALAILLLVGGVVVTDAYAAELTLARARGGSSRQLSARVLGTAAGWPGRPWSPAPSPGSPSCPTAATR